MTAPLNISDLSENTEFTANLLGVDVKFPMAANVKQELKRYMEAKGLTSFTLVIDGSEIISANDIPETFGDCDSIEVYVNAKAGVN